MKSGIRAQAVDGGKTGTSYKNAVTRIGFHTSEKPFDETILKGKDIAKMICPDGNTAMGERRLAHIEAIARQIPICDLAPALEGPIAAIIASQPGITLDMLREISDQLESLMPASRMAHLSGIAALFGSRNGDVDLEFMRYATAILEMALPAERVAVQEWVVQKAFSSAQASKGALKQISKMARHFEKTAHTWDFLNSVSPVLNKLQQWDGAEFLSDMGQRMEGMQQEDRLFFAYKVASLAKKTAAAEKNALFTMLDTAETETLAGKRIQTEKGIAAISLERQSTCHATLPFFKMAFLLRQAIKLTAGIPRELHAFSNTPEGLARKMSALGTPLAHFTGEAQAPMRDEGNWCFADDKEGNSYYIKNTDGWIEAFICAETPVYAKGLPLRDAALEAATGHFILYEPLSGRFFRARLENGKAVEPKPSVKCGDNELRELAYRMEELDGLAQKAGRKSKP